MRSHQQWHENEAHLKLNFVKDLKLPAQVTKLGVVLKVDRLVRNCGLDAIFLCKQKNINNLYKADNLTNQNISGFGECMTQS